MTAPAKPCQNEHIDMAFCTECGWIPAGYRALEAELVDAKDRLKVGSQWLKSEIAAREKAEAEVERLKTTEPRCPVCGGNMVCLQPSSHFKGGGRESGELRSDSVSASLPELESTEGTERPGDTDKAGQRSKSVLGSAAVNPAARNERRRAERAHLRWLREDVRKEAK